MRSGLTEEQVSELATYDSSSVYSPLEKLVLRYADELTRTVRTSDEIMAELKMNLSEADIVELTVTVGLANLTNRFNMSLLTDPD